MVINARLLHIHHTRNNHATAPHRLGCVFVSPPHQPFDFGTLPIATALTVFGTASSGMAGWGQAARFEVTGPQAAQQIQEWFTSLELSAQISGAVPGQAPITLVSLGFSPNDTSIAMVPQQLIGWGDQGPFQVRIHTRTPPEHPPLTRPGRITYSDGAVSIAAYEVMVATATARIAAGKARKVVLSRDLLAVAERPIDERYLLQRLMSAYPSCYTFAVDHLLGASPELLVARHGNTVLSRVLAGTGWSEHGADPSQVAAHLLASGKDQREHRMAADSVAAALAPTCTDLHVPAEPSPLTLAHLVHLATDVSGTLRPDGPSALQLAALLHPTAAVGGTPTQAALSLINELEPVQRGRYAAPVGWLSADGDGEFALALRCGEVSGNTVRLRAGGGIVAGSDPATEAIETQVKMLPIREALEG